MLNRWLAPAGCLTLLVTVCAFAAEPPPQPALYEVKPLGDELAAEYALDPAFYKKATTVQGIVIATSGAVSDTVHRETAYVFDHLMRDMKPAIAQRIRDRKLLCLIIGHAELTSDLPQFGSDKTGKELDFYNWRNRGFFRMNLNGHPTVVFAEEDVMEYDGGMQLESILVHEFGHVVDGLGLDADQRKMLMEAYANTRSTGIWMDGYAAQKFRRVTSDTPVGLRDALVAAFPDHSPKLIEAAMSGGSVLVNGKPCDVNAKVTKDDKVLIVFGGPKECYHAKNRAEYFAEVYQTWYDTNRTMDHDHNHIQTRAALKEYDPAAAKLLDDVLGDGAWRFVSPRQRAGKDHLTDYDPAKAPKVTKLPHIDAAAQDYYDKYWHDYWKRLAEKHGVEDASVEAAAPAAQ